LISRNHKSLVWQYINWEKVVQYIDSLKSRKYKAFVQKSHVINYRLQSSFINSPLVILFAFKQSIDSLNIKLNTFELGYILFCISKVLYLDIGFLYYYRNIYDIQLIKVIRYLVAKVHYLVIFWSIQIYANYLRYLCHLSYYRFYNTNDVIDIIKSQVTRYQHVLLLDLKYSINYFSLLTFLNKMSVDKNICQFLLKFLHVGYFNNLTAYVNIKSNNLFIKKNILFKQLLDIFVLQLCYEMSIVFSKYFDIKNNLNKIICINEGSLLLILSQDADQLIKFKKKLLHLLFFNGFIVKLDKRIARKYISQGISTSLFCISIKKEVYPFYFFIKPSLRNQFTFMKQVSLILYNLRSRPSFLLNIRLNMLILLWSNTYLKQSVNKIFYLLDYLISLKLRYSSKYRRYYSCSKVKFSKKILHSQLLSYVLKKTYIYMFTTIYSQKYYKYYFAVKLLWISNLK